jgi:predicted nuclease of predicted toxin-antitoxin system
MRLLLDEHLPARLAEQLRQNGIECEIIATWRGGALLGARDAQILEAAAAEGWVLVTYDVHTIPRLLRDRAELGLRHAGVIFVSTARRRQTNIGQLLERLLELLEEMAGQDWQDVCRFLRPR